MAALPTLESNLPNLTDVKSWAKGKNAPLIRPGGHGLNAQAQQIISNLEVNIRPIRQEIAQLLHARPHTTSKALVARLCGLKRKLVVPALSRVERRGECNTSFREGGSARVGGQESAGEDAGGAEGGGRNEQVAGGRAGGRSHKM